ncbi:MAG: hypothetical protein M1828_002575 [Chrysothrix sp. TS-e1954]|nr:MAG: hypothetical protein M1828_002575 [Chrysothrix sp. TS-e1954]
MSNTESVQRKSARPDVLGNTRQVTTFTALPAEIRARILFLAIRRAGDDAHESSEEIRKSFEWHASELVNELGLQVTPKLPDPGSASISTRWRLMELGLPDQQRTRTKFRQLRSTVVGNMYVHECSESTWKHHREFDGRNICDCWGLHCWRLTSDGGLDDRINCCRNRICVGYALHAAKMVLDLMATSQVIRADVQSLVATNFEVWLRGQAAADRDQGDKERYPPGTDGKASADQSEPLLLWVGRVKSGKCFEKRPVPTIPIPNSYGLARI